MANAQGGQSYPQEFALGILNLYTTLQNRKAQLQEMRADRSARNLLEEQRLQLDQGNQQFNQEMQKAQFASLQAERDAEMKYRYDVLRENRKAAAQDAVTKFAAGQATFFPMGVPLPKAPTVKTPEGKEVPQFEYDSYEMPGLGTYVLPRNKYAEQLQLSDHAEAIQKDRMTMLRDLMQADHDQAQAEFFEAQARALDAEPHDPKRVQLAQAFYLKINAQEKSFIEETWPLYKAEEKAKYLNNAHTAFEAISGPENVQLLKDAQKILNSYYTTQPAAAATKPNEGAGANPAKYSRFMNRLAEAQDFMKALGTPVPTATAPAAPSESSSGTLAGSNIPSGHVAVERPADPTAWPGVQLTRDYRERDYYNPDGSLAGRQLVKKGKIVSSVGNIPGEMREPGAGTPAGGALPGAAPGGLADPALVNPAIHLEGLTDEENTRVNQLIIKARVTQLSDKEYRELSDLSRKRSVR